MVPEIDDVSYYKYSDIPFPSFDISRTLFRVLCIFIYAQKSLDFYINQSFMLTVTLFTTTAANGDDHEYHHDGHDQ